MDGPSGRTNGPGRRFGNLLLAGLVAVLPLFLTVWILYVVFGFVDGILSPVLSRVIVHYLNSSGFLELPAETRIPGIGLLATTALVLLSGLLVRNVLGRSLVAAFEHLLGMLPVAGWILSSAKQLLGFFSAKKSFSRAVLIEFPRPGAYAIGFVTGKVDAASARAMGGPGFTYVFVSSTPNPTGGILLMVPDDRVFPLNISVDEAVKLVVTAGILTEERPEEGAPGARNRQ